MELPLTQGEGDVVAPAKPGEGLINTTYVLGFDLQARPVPIYHRYDAAGRSQIHAARRSATGCEIKALTDWNARWAFGGMGSIEVDIFLLAPRAAAGGTLLVAYSARPGPGGVLEFDPERLTTVRMLPPDPALLPDKLMKPSDPAGP